MRVERRLFHSTFGLQDQVRAVGVPLLTTIVKQTEGMAAFVGKRKPAWTHS
jgi:hypothetical protein